MKNKMNDKLKRLKRIFVYYMSTVTSFIDDLKYRRTDGEEELDPAHSHFRSSYHKVTTPRSSTLPRSPDLQNTLGFERPAGERQVNGRSSPDRTSPSRYSPVYTETLPAEPHISRAAGRRAEETTPSRRSAKSVSPVRPSHRDRSSRLTGQKSLPPADDTVRRVQPLVRPLDRVDHADMHTLR